MLGACSAPQSEALRPWLSILAAFQSWPAGPCPPPATMADAIAEFEARAAAAEAEIARLTSLLAAKPAANPAPPKSAPVPADSALPEAESAVDPRAHVMLEQVTDMASKVRCGRPLLWTVIAPGADPPPPALPRINALLYQTFVFSCREPCVYIVCPSL